MRKTVVGIALLLTLAACGGQQATSSAPATTTAAPVTDAVQLASLAKSSAATGKSVTITGQVTKAGTQILMSGPAVIDGSSSSMDLTVTTPTAKEEVELVDKVIYLKLPADAMAKAGVSTPWIKLGGGTDPLSQALSGGLDQMAQNNDPTKVLDQISKYGKITRTQQTTLNGQPVTHYGIVLDGKKMAADLPADLASQVPATTDLDLWINADHLPVQVVSSAGDLYVTVKYSNWGEKVDVQAPPANQVTDAATLKH